MTEPPCQRMRPRARRDGRASRAAAHQTGDDDGSALGGPLGARRPAGEPENGVGSAEKGKRAMRCNERTCARGSGQGRCGAACGPWQPPRSCPSAARRRAVATAVAASPPRRPHCARGTPARAGSRRRAARLRRRRSCAACWRTTPPTRACSPRSRGSRQGLARGGASRRGSGSWRRRRAQGSRCASGVQQHRGWVGGCT